MLKRTRRLEKIPETTLKIRKKRAKVKFFLYIIPLKINRFTRINNKKRQQQQQQEQQHLN